MAAHPGEQVAQLVARLGGAGGPVLDSDHAAGDHRRGEERRRAGEVRLDVPARGRPAGPARPATRPGRSRPRPAPAARSICTVIRRCGAAGHAAAAVADHDALVVARTRRAAGRTRAGWTRRRRSSTSPPRTLPCPCTLTGSPPVGLASIRTPSSLQRPSSGASGRSRARGSPSKVTVPSASAATGEEAHDRAGQAHVDVGRSGQWARAAPSTAPRPLWRRGQPMARSPAAISSVSRARSGRRRVVGPTQIARGRERRAVIDLEPGTRTDACTGENAVGADPV